MRGKRKQSRACVEFRVSMNFQLRLNYVRLVFRASISIISLAGSVFYGMALWGVNAKVPYEKRVPGMYRVCMDVYGVFSQ